MKPSNSELEIILVLADRTYKETIVWFEGNFFAIFTEIRLNIFVSSSYSIEFKQFSTVFQFNPSNEISGFMLDSQLE